ncbi:MAG: hypothetical protein H6581_09490 [Bacteroidia bacterium]|nr:hypothetical protein [Bacteroidia bacterium]
MKSKREKITFETVNEGNYTLIDHTQIAQVNTRVKSVMKDVVKKYEKNQVKSRIQAQKLILNS